MNSSNIDSSFSTQCSADQCEQRSPLFELCKAFVSLNSIYKRDYIKNRNQLLEMWKMREECVDSLRLGKEISTLVLKEIYECIDAFRYFNTPFYHQYVQASRQKDWYIDYATELPKIKHDIFENEVTWYTENLPKLSQIAQKEKRSPFIKPIANQDPREARHTRMVIDHALEQLEKMDQKIKEAPSLEGLQNLQQDVERYGWCLTGMAPLLPVEEQNPFQEGCLYQRWQKARVKIQEAEDLWHQNH